MQDNNIKEKSLLNDRKIDTVSYSPKNTEMIMTMKLITNSKNSSGFTEIVPLDPFDAFYDRYFASINLISFFVVSEISTIYLVRYFLCFEGDKVHRNCAFR